MNPKITARNYFDLLPEPGHRPGDIWSGLPTHGLLRWKITGGIIVTPACDLQNRKVETLTYLPIVPVQGWLVTAGFLGEVRAEVNSCMDKLEGGRPLGLPRLPRSPRRQEAENLISALERTSRAGEPLADAVLARIHAGLRHIDRTLTGAVQPLLQDLAILFGDKKWRELREKIVTNSLRSDLHFLPADGADPDWSGVPEHSVVLFRYPFSAPIDVFDAAMDVQQRDWKVALEQFRGACPGVDCFVAHRPEKRTRLQDRFLADVLTRYVGLYSRLGSPDFSADTARAVADELGRLR